MSYPSTTGRAVLNNRRLQHPQYPGDILAVPIEEVKEVFDPRGVCRALLNGVSSMPEVHLRKFREAHRIITSLGIPAEDIGVWGGLQCFMKSNVPNVSSHDYDFLIYGLEHLQTIKERPTDLYPAPNGSRWLDTSLRVWRRALHRRNSYTVVLGESCDGSEIYIELKFVRKPEDPDSYPYDWVHSDEETVITEAVVTDDSEGPCLPSVFTVETDNGREMKVATDIFYYLGSAWKGDRITISGYAADDSLLMLVDPENHFILHGDS